MSSYYGLTGETLHRVAVVLRVIVEDEGLRYGRLHTQENAVRDRTTRGSQRVSEGLRGSGVTPNSATHQKV